METENENSNSKRLNEAEENGKPPGGCAALLKF